MNTRKLILIVIVLLVVGFGVVYLTKNYETSIRPNFSQAKMDEVKNRNEALFNELMTNFDKYKEQIKENPENIGAWTELGVIADTFGDDALAEHAYSKVIELDPSVFLVRHNLAVLYIRQNKFAEAEAQYKAILNNNPADIQTHESLARLYASGKIGSIEDAKRILDAGIKQTNDPGLTDLRARLERGETL